MNHKNTLDLVEAAPLLYRLHGTKTGWPIGYGFQCGDGWFDILLQLSQKIEVDLQAMRDRFASAPMEDLPHALQVKEKFGGLRFYMNLQSERWADWIREAEVEAFKTCERCGAPGAMHIRGGFLQTLCPTCAKREGFVLAELEEPEEEIDAGIRGLRLRVSPVLKARKERHAPKGKARAAFMAARPLLLLNPRSPANLEIAFPRTARPVMERLADRLEAELRRLVKAGLPLDALPIVTRFTCSNVEIEPGTIPAEAEAEFDAAITEALVVLSGTVELDEGA